MNHYGTKKLQQNFLYELAKLDWQFFIVGMYTLFKDSIRIRIKNNGKRKRNKKVNSGNSVEESSNEHLDQNSNDLIESFLSDSSDTLNDDLIGLSKQRLTCPKNLIIGHLKKNSVRDKFPSLWETVLSKTDIFLLSETKIDDSFPILNSSQKDSRRTIKIGPKGSVTK